MFNTQGYNIYEIVIGSAAGSGFVLRYNLNTIEHIVLQETLLNSKAFVPYWINWNFGDIFNRKRLHYWLEFVEGVAVELQFSCR